MFKENLIFGSNEDVIYIVILWFLMNLTKHMDQFDWNEDMRLLDDKKVPQVSKWPLEEVLNMVMIIPFNYTPDLCVVEVLSSVLGHFLGIVVLFPLWRWILDIYASIERF